jgi:hypothetical protein
MSLKAKFMICFGVAVAPWLSAVPASAGDSDNLGVTAIVQLNSGQIMGAFDIGWVDAKIGTYVLAASRLSATNCPSGCGPGSNPGIVVVDTTSLLLTNELGPTPFAGSCANPGKRDLVGFSGPNGVTITKRGQGKSLGNAEVWAGDGPIVSPPCPIDPSSGKPNGFTGEISGNTLTVTAPCNEPIGRPKVGDTIVGLDANSNPNVAPHTTIVSGMAGCPGTFTVSGAAQTVGPESMSAFNVTDPGARSSQVVVFDYKTGNLITTVSTGGLYRADELCFSPQDGVVFVANDEGGDNFGTFIDIKTHKVIQTMKFDGTDPDANHITGIGLEQCQYNPRDGKIYFNIPDSVPSGGTGGVPPGGGHTVRFAPTSTKPLHYHIETDFTNADIIACGPAGLAVGPANQLALGCGGNGGLIISDLNGKKVVTFSGLGSIDEDWYNPGNNHYYFANSTPGSLLAGDAGNLGDTPCTGAGCPVVDTSVNTASGSHSVAADSVSNNVFVPIKAGSAGSGTACGSSASIGCIAIYHGTNDGDDLSAGKKPITGN